MEKQGDGYNNKKRKRKNGGNKAKRDTKRVKKHLNLGKRGTVMNVDQLAWKKISIENDEFDDFEEIEGVDVDYVDKDGSKVIQFKVFLHLPNLC